MEFSLEFKKAIFEEERRLQVEIEVAQSRLKALDAIKKLWQNGTVIPVSEFLTIPGAIIEEATPMPAQLEAAAVELPKTDKSTTDKPRAANKIGIVPFLEEYEAVKVWMQGNLAQGVEYPNAQVKKFFPQIKPWNFSSIFCRLANDDIIHREDHSRVFTYGKKKVSTEPKLPVIKKDELDEIIPESIPEVDPDVVPEGLDDDDDDTIIVPAPPIKFKTQYKPTKVQGKLNKTKFVETIGRHLIRQRNRMHIVKSPETFWILFNSNGNACEDLLAGNNQEWVIS